jgi:hypothetical protein
MRIKNSKDEKKINKIQRAKRLDNSICAYRNCCANSTVRLYFPLGFSALFCNDCAKILIEESLAKESEDAEIAIFD